MLSRKILHLRSSRSLAGPERHLLELLPGLGRRGFAAEVALLYRRRPGDPAEHPGLARFAAAGIPCFQIDDAGRPGGSARRAVAERLGRGDLAALHGHDPKSDWVIAGALRMAGRRPREAPVRRLATLHLYTCESLPLRLYRLLDLRLLRRFDGVIAVTSALAAELATGTRSRVISNGIDGAGLCARAARSRQGGTPDAGGGGAPVLVAAGRLTRQKGFDLLLQALPAVVAQRPDLRVLIAGEGPERRALAGQAGRLRLQERVRFLGARDDLEALFAAAHGFVLPSRSEGSPYVLLEAMALGLPVVATEVGGVPAMLDGGANGLLVRAEDPPALAAAILSLVQFPQAAERRAELARQAIAGPLSASRMADATADFYADVLQ